jgi:hypothetical protein
MEHLGCSQWLVPWAFGRIFSQRDRRIHAIGAQKAISNALIGAFVRKIVGRYRAYVAPTASISALTPKILITRFML